MFLTKSGCELPYPSDVFGDQVQQWVAMTIAAELPWFLAVTKFFVKRRPCLQTTAFAWESSVISLVENAPPRAVLAMHYVAPCKHRHGWTMSRISELWRPAEEEKMPAASLLMRFEGRESLYNWLDVEVSAVHPGRKQILRLEL